MPLTRLARIIRRLLGGPTERYASSVVLTSSGVGVPIPQLTRQPDGVELLKDVAPAVWIAERIQGWSAEEGGSVGTRIPEGFESYARIFHPAKYRSEDRKWHRVNWATVAECYGKVVHPQMDFCKLVNLKWLEHPSWGSRPQVGTLPEEECRPLVDVLSEFTSTPELCYFGVWEGYAGLDVRLDKGAAKLESPHLGRAYYIFRGPLDGVLSFHEWWYFNRSPNIWWPEDRAWCVATEIDDQDTFVGGSAACIERVLAHPELEALPIAIDARIDHYGDTINV